MLDGLRFGGGGSGAGLMSSSGEARKEVGDGIVIVSILTAPYRETSTTAAVLLVDEMSLYSR